MPHGPPRPAPIPPRVDALVLCEKIIVDRRSGKPTLVGVTDSIVASRFPTHIDEPLCVYANMTGLRGLYRFHVIVVAPDLATTVAESTEDGLVQTSDPLARGDVQVVLSPIALPGPGRYGIRLMYDEFVAAEISLSVRGAESSP